MAIAGCAASPTSTGVAIQSATGRDLTSVVAGDALALELVETFSDGSTQPASGATWTAPITVETLDPDSTADSPIPAFGATPTSVFVDNALRVDRNDDLAGVLFVLDAGSTAGAVFAAGCATCHGVMAAGTMANADGSFTVDGGTYAYPAPGLDTEMGNLASDPDWNAALLAVAARNDMDNGGLELRAPMPDWFADTSTGALLSTQDFADIYAYLVTQPPM
ncbi:MAG TPA: c-type cytochrome [Kofleriaceae bacterium]|nr:c-type cytochrome [Kofleriaceae bacterium]